MNIDTIRVCENCDSVYDFEPCPVCALEHRVESLEDDLTALRRRIEQLEKEVLEPEDFEKETK